MNATIKNKSLLFLVLLLVAFSLNTAAKASFEKKCTSDTCQISILLDSANFLFKNGNLKGASSFANEGLRRAIKLGLDSLEAEAFYLIGKISFKQNNYTSSLTEYNKALKLFQILFTSGGTTKTLNSIGIIYERQSQYPIALEYYNKSFAIAEKNKDYNAQSIALTNMGIVYEKQNQFFKSLDAYYKALDISKRVNDKVGQAKTLMGIGIINNTVGSFPKALDCYLQALSIAEETKESELIVSLLLNIGLIQTKQKNYELALNYFEKALKSANEIDNKRSISDCYNHIASILYYKKEYLESLKYRKEALSIKIQINDEKGIGLTYNNIGNVYKDISNEDSAFYYYSKAMEIAESIGDKKLISTTHINLGDVFIKNGKVADGIKLINEGIEIAELKSYTENVKNGYEILSVAYEKLNNHKASLASYKKASVLKDSLSYSEKTQEMMRKSMEYEFDKEQQKAIIERERLEKENKAKLESEQLKTKYFTILTSVVFVLILVIVVSLINTRRKNSIIEFQITRAEKNKKIVELQKREIEEINNELISSINYSQKLQIATLPKVEDIRKVFADSFVLYKPKSIVSGDFYWLADTADVVYFAVADCTGHGIPGALVSMIGTNLLSSSVIEFGIKNPAEILDKLTELIKIYFEKSATTISDGMDISLCALNKQTRILEWAGANNPLWIIRDKKIIELTPNKQPISNFVETKKFTNHTLPLQDKDCIYLFSDGYADQFGGEKGKKFKYKHLAETLINMNNIAMSSQGSELDLIFEKWKGLNEQVDDVTLMGIRI
ncbi:MAG: tetratricopeptide repeat protein [Bacteroidetes bacterium]|nr:tetratricopeptide repeat protein [Bacteroidota bacterium]